MKFNSFIYLIICCISLGCSNPNSKTNPNEASVKSKIEIDTLTIQKHLHELSHDRYEGRMPCSPGGIKTTEYLVNQMKKMGLQPGNKGSFTQDVSLLTLAADIHDKMIVETKAGKQTWQKGKDFVIHSERKSESLGLENSELVFCGYGIVDEKLGSLKVRMVY